MNADIFNTLPTRQGHFRLESGYHASLWLSLDALFVSPRRVAPLVTELANRLRLHGMEAVCGPLVGGAFLAHAVATALDVDFYCAEPVPMATSSGVFKAQYRLPAALHHRLNGVRVAIVDDTISAGSSVRATAAAVREQGAKTVAVGTFLLLGGLARDHFASFGIPLEALAERDFTLWEPAECPLCRAGVPLADTGKEKTST